MPNKKPLKKDSELRAFIKAGGRKGAKSDFNTILKQAIRPKTHKPKDKSK